VSKRIAYIRVYVNICVGELCESFEYVLGDYVLGEPWRFICISELGEMCT